MKALRSSEGRGLGDRSKEISSSGQQSGAMEQEGALKAAAMEEGGRKRKYPTTAAIEDGQPVRRNREGLLTNARLLRLNKKLLLISFQSPTDSDAPIGLKIYESQKQASNGQDVTSSAGTTNL
jgi:hypothetical protein